LDLQAKSNENREHYGVYICDGRWPLGCTVFSSSAVSVNPSCKRPRYVFPPHGSALTLCGAAALPAIRESWQCTGSGWFCRAWIFLSLDQGYRDGPLVKRYCDITIRCLLRLSEISDNVCQQCFEDILLDIPKRWLGEPQAPNWRLSQLVEHA